MSCSSSSLFICNLTSYRATDPNARYQMAGVVFTPVVGVLAAPVFLFSQGLCFSERMGESRRSEKRTETVRFDCLPRLPGMSPNCVRVSSSTSLTRF